jgi:hypothetical protein
MSVHFGVCVQAEDVGRIQSILMDWLKSVHRITSVAHQDGANPEVYGSEFNLDEKPPSLLLVRQEGRRKARRFVGLLRK